MLIPTMSDKLSDRGGKAPGSEAGHPGPHGYMYQGQTDLMIILGHTVSGATAGGPAIS